MIQTNTTVTTTNVVLIDYSTLEQKIRYLLIQNTHASNQLFIRLDGATATAANGILIDAGKAIEIHLPADMGINKDITGIADIAGTTVIIAYE